MKHEMLKFQRLTFGQRGYYNADCMFIAICSCGWESAESHDHKALVALWDIHQRPFEAKIT